MDPLSDLLSLLKPQNYMSAGFDAGGDWAIQFSDQQNSIKTGAVIAGSCWLAVEGVAEPVRLEEGDCFVLPLGRPFRLATDLALPATAASNVFSVARQGGIVTYNGGGDCFLVSNRFALAGDPAGRLLEMLPPIVHIRRGTHQSSLRWSMERMMQELRAVQPGGFLILQHLAHTMLIEVLRLHLADEPTGNGLLAALADRQMNAAISAMHGDPAHHWTLQELAAQIGKSRSAFAQRFKQTVGMAPMEYLTQWRMLLAGDRLAGAREPVSSIALSLGYESESAFSTAFKRVMGQPPRQYARGRSARPRPEPGDRTQPSRVLSAAE
ncbi:AraC family transcriptional regulator [Consotaella aegiceratis]|uniref:AraC family transcriptional regulator n=1 Tax=Consotaella aegiceratis TaxID=3097961 RepID=UPI002F3FC24B